MTRVKKQPTIQPQLQVVIPYEKGKNYFIQAFSDFTT